MREDKCSHSAINPHSSDPNPFMAPRPIFAHVHTHAINKKQKKLHTHIKGLTNRLNASHPIKEPLDQVQPLSMSNIRDVSSVCIIVFYPTYPYGSAVFSSHCDTSRFFVWFRNSCSSVPRCFVQGASVGFSVFFGAMIIYAEVYSH